MKRTIISLLLLLSFIKPYAQESQVERNIFGVQLGMYPISFYNECRLFKEIALRSEIGFSYLYESTSSLYGYSSSSQWAIIPEINLEPRFYYNLKHRNNLGKRTNNNSANYLSINFGYKAVDLAIFKSNSLENVFSSIHIIPMYGVRRSIGNNFNFEFAAGIGREWTFEKYNYYNLITHKNKTYKNIESDIAFGLRLAIGYVF
ncbi:hypothetical protein [Plebeiibacterium sediminum]|uniref:DUF3575 domain-containing protein n=1 Tax=Plebeiibacterium sediminum TaxID=2992112 RepID=A0AAE3M6K5_9BACT|nr:hypothetical protein [Plebeiobacterium sediminum]MCW3788159.1 hypothetical protein [Plebeiobacterium sediminum]